MTTGNIDFMDVACLDGFKVLKLPYEPGAAPRTTRYSMLVFLPDARDGLSTMVDVVTASPAYLYGILAEMKEKPVIMQLPKFEISFSWSDLKRDLCRLGLSLPFLLEAADLRGMCKGDDDVAGGERRPTFLSKVAHKAVVKVNEAGTEATAVTVGLRGGGGPPPDLVKFTADHPFTFFIIDEGAVRGDRVRRARPRSNQVISIRGSTKSLTVASLVVIISDCSLL
ncbi:putative serpin-Z5 [Panicum virgatum]|uniref:putative serpin-Z5 n=1 Tax=Panicum virgatum TaxID=38727 RepID=UPI0019D5363F|nr:putative serpin-Z5 [Panicum virgatum]